VYGYEIQKWLEISHTELWADVLPGSIYHALRQMEKEGPVQVQATQQRGHRARAIYALTQAGREMFQLLLREGWQQVPRTFPSNLCTLLTFSHHLPSEERRAGLQTMLAALEKELAQWGEGEQAKRDTFLGRVFSLKHLSILSGTGHNHRPQPKIHNRHHEKRGIPDMIGQRVHQLQQHPFNGNPYHLRENAHRRQDSQAYHARMEELM
jgi:DNA-binding PadR family transcriptional regulator